MAQEEIKYTIPSEQGSNDGRQVDLIVTYDPTKPNADGSFTATSATGTYSIVDDNGNVIKTDTITGLTPPGGKGGNDNEFFIVSNPTTTPIVTGSGLTFSISDPADSNDPTPGDPTYGQVNFYDASGNSARPTAPTDTPYYAEQGFNLTRATVTEDNPAVCFVTGTRIRIVRDEAIVDVAVEDLRVGDRAVTASGAHRPIRWLGHRTMSCHLCPRPSEVLPVRIAAHAFGANRPVRDLTVSPGHAICVDLLGEVLIPASVLINGTTVRQVEVETVTYWHVELETHDILLAENLPAESYLDMGNRAFFAGSDVVELHAQPDACPDADRRTHADFCRPYHNDGVFIEAVRSQLAARAVAMGWRLDDSAPLADLHLIVDGARIDAAARGLSLCFMLPAGAEDVWLVSEAARPCDVAERSDSRRLGVCVGRLTINDGFDTRPIDLADPRLGVGFHAVEDGVRRWTTGRARLPSALWDGCAGTFFLRVDLVGPALPRWIAPADMPAATGSMHGNYAVGAL